MNRALLAALVSVFVWPALAAADVIHLKNGRTMEGQVLKTKKGMIHLKVPGGRLTIPASTVKKVEKRRTPQEEYGEKVQRTNMSSPSALRKLASWASRRGLGEQAIQLRNQAKGLELEARVAAVRSAKGAGPFLDLYHWAQDQRHSKQVLRWLLEKALERDPTHGPSQIALQGMNAAEDRLARRHDKPQPPTELEKIGALEAKLEAQQVEAEQLRARLAALENDARLRGDAVTKHHENLRRRRLVRRRARNRRPSRVLVPVAEEAVATPGARSRTPLYGAPVRLKFD
jgi:hypothetical protein